MRAISLFVFLLCLCLARPLSAQSPPTFSIKRLDSSNGLQYDSRNIFTGEDGKGFLWIGSTGGPYRYDGQILNYIRSNSRRDDSQVISDFFSIDQENVWASHNTGLYQFKHTNDELTRYEIEIDKAAPLGLQLFAVDTSAGLLWLANGSEVIAVHPDTPTVVKHRASSKSIRHVVLEAGGAAKVFIGLPWLLSPGLERITIRPSGQVEVKKSADRAINALTLNGGTVDHQGRIWLIGDNGLYSYDFQRDKLIRRYKLPNGKSQKIYDIETYEQWLLVATERDGVWWFDPERGTFLRKLNAGLPNEKRPTNQPLALRILAGGEIVVSPESGGIEVLVPNTAEVDLLLEDLTTDYYGNGLTQDRFGNLHVIRGDQTIVSYDPGGVPLFTFDPNIQATDSRPARIHLQTSGDGQTFCSYNDRLYKLTHGSNPFWERIVDRPGGFEQLLPLPYSILARDSNRLFLLKEQTWQELELPRALTKATFLYTPNDETLLIEEGDGVLRLARVEEQRVSLFDSVRVSRVQLTSAQFGANSDTLLLGAYNGLLRYVKDSLGRWYYHDNQVPDVHVEAITYLQQRQETWLLSDQGLAVGRDSSWRFVREEHGLPDGSGLSNTMYLCGDSIVWAGVKRGLMRYRIDRSPTTSRVLPPVYLRRLIFNGERVSHTVYGPERPLKYAGRSDQVQLSFSALGLYDLVTPSYEYRLMDSDQEWTPLGQSGVLSLPPLAPGSYNLQVRYTDMSGRKSRAYVVGINSTIPYWQTWWFSFLVILGIGAFVGGISYWVYASKLAKERQRYEAELQVARERQRIARELHDNLSADIGSILYISDTAGEPLTKEDQEEIIDLSQGALIRMREIVHTIEGKDTTLGRVWDLLVRDFDTNCRRYKTASTSTNEVAKELLATPVSSPTQRNVSLLVKEAVMNALKHGEPALVQLTLKQVSRREVELSISDDGKGFVEAEINSGVGLVSLRDRSAILGATLVIESRPGVGSHIRLLWPILNP